MLRSFHAALHITSMRIREQPGRITYLVLTLAVAVLAWNVLAAFASPFLATKMGDAIHAELYLSNAAVEGDSFPLRYMQQIERMPGVAAVDYKTLAAFPCADMRTVVTINAVGGSNVVPQLRRDGVSMEDITQWSNTRNGLLVGAEIAEKCGLIPGMLLTPQDFVNGIEIPVSIVGILPDNNDNPYYSRMAYGHYNYVNQIIPEHKRDLVRIASVEAVDSSKLAQLGEAIEREFASADPPLEASASSGEDSLLGRFGQVQGLLGLMMAAMGACALLVFVTVMAHLLAQRRASMAALQTMGFDRRLQFVALLLELSAIMLVGTVLGVVGALTVLSGLSPSVSWLFGQLHIPDWALAGLLPALAVLALAALVWPTVQIARLKPIDYLRG